MFTGIIELKGIVTEIISSGTNKTFWIRSPVSGEFQLTKALPIAGFALLWKK